jgi:hypothetical protein
MPTATLDHHELARRGREYYDRFLRARLEPQSDGKFLALEVETGDYELGDSSLDALDRAETKHPDSVFCILRVGHRTAGRIGAQPRRGQP